MTVAQLTEELDRCEHESLFEECEAFERLLQAELRALAIIRSTEKRWGDALRAGSLTFDFQFDKEITRRYRRWALNARRCLRQLELQEAKDCYPEAAAEFRQNLEEAEEILLLRTQDETSASEALQDSE